MQGTNSFPSGHTLQSVQNLGDDDVVVVNSQSVADFIDGNGNMKARFKAKVVGFLPAPNSLEVDQARWVVK